MPIIRSIQGKNPIIHPSVFIAESAVIIGEVSIDAGSSIWYNVVLRGDVHFIKVGENTNIQDGAIVHCTYQKASTTIGNNVTIGHKAMIHGCHIHDNVLIGMSATILDHAVIEPFVIVAAGALVLEKTYLESGYLYAGVPAKKIKPLTQEQLEGIQQYARNYQMYCSWYKIEEHI
ncbi:MAG: gamma carbonic anhydrase family protein [Bacteroidia bacterium]|nr:gamma carbonic anhydrase family protein [Bacteroidia bacterium]MDW8158858.1 gamma carbonic anhydrase family protein [Bacteroidia bacterium]